MSDDNIPAWAEAMEHRIIAEVGKAIADSEGRLRTEMDRRFKQVDGRFDQIHDDLTVSMVRADRAHQRIDQEVGALRDELSRLWSRVRAMERRLGIGDGNGGTQPS